VSPPVLNYDSETTLNVNIIVNTDPGNSQRRPQETDEHFPIFLLSLQIIVSLSHYLQERLELGNFEGESDDVIPHYCVVVLLLPRLVFD